MVNQWICSFFMGLFFIGGGYTYRYREDWLIRNFRAILVPYYLWAIIGLLFVFAKNGISAGGAETDMLQKTLRTITGVSADNYPLWFLVAYFVSKSVYDLINRCVNSGIFSRHWHLSPVVPEIAAVLLAATIGYFYAANKPVGHSVFRFDTGLILVPLFTVGRYAPMLFARINGKMRSLLACVLFLSVNVITGLIFNRLVSVNSNEYGNIFSFYASTVSGTLCVFLICRQISGIRRIGKLLGYLGENSLIILCCHYFFLFFIGYASISLFPVLREYPIISTALCVALMLPAIPWLKKLTDAIVNLTTISGR